MKPFYVSNKAILVNPRGKILLVTLEDGRDDLPGGRMDDGEEVSNGLVREIREETGLEIDGKAARPFFVARRYYRGSDAWVVCIFYVVPVGDVDIALSDEHVSFRWVDPRQETSADPEVAEVIEAYRRSEGIVVAADEGIKGHQGLGLVQVLTGNGKGKTTAALGEAVRAHGAGKRVGIVYFDKGGTSHYNERTTLDALGIPYVATGRDRIDPVSGRFDFSIQPIDREEAIRGLAAARAFFADGIDVVVLDEINSTADLGMLTPEDVLALIDDKPERTELVLTGRNAPDTVLERAHLVTEMRLRRHYFYSGVQARGGIDY